MPGSLILPVRDCKDSSLVGGKAFGLFRLLSTGFSVPDGLCVTTEAYRQHLRRRGVEADERWRSVSQAAETERGAAFAECRSLILGLDLSDLAAQCRQDMIQVGDQPNGRWAVRSSATNEDAAQASSAGLYRTHLGVAAADLEWAIQDLWASIWNERVLRYVQRAKRLHDAPAMAVVIQPMLEALVAGVAYSVHPVTGRSNQVTVNAVLGLAEPLAAGLVVPDQYVVQMSDDGEPVNIRSRSIGNKSERLIVGDDGVHRDPIPEADRAQASLTDVQLIAVARLTKQVERAFGGPMDVEWAIDQRRLWLLQARPVTVRGTSVELTNDDCEWSRANFKETMPEVPSPLGRSFLEYFMDTYIVGHYRRLGCHIPDGLSPVRIAHGRPYLNVTLFHSFVGQLRGDTSLIAEHVGGEPLSHVPPVTPLGGLRLIRAITLILAEMRRVQKHGPGWFAEMKELASDYHPNRICNWSIEDLEIHLDALSRWLDRREVTFGIATGMGQCLQWFSAILPRWFGEDWRRLLNEALQGQGSVISAQQILRLADVVQVARQDESVSGALLSRQSDRASLRRRMPTSAFFEAFDRYLEEYGHRGVGESDVMSPRFGDEPDALLDVIRAQLRGPAFSAADLIGRQRATSAEAVSTIRSRLGRRLDRRLVFLWWYRRFCRFCALREANRHHLMRYSTAARNLLLCLGQRLVQRGIFALPEDVFFLTLDERASVISDHARDWAAIAKSRRADRERWLAMQVPDTVNDWQGTVGSGAPMRAVPGDSHERLQGLPISAGVATGRARLVRSTEDWKKVQAGDIIVAPVIDPGLAPLFGLAAGIVVEMGGTLSHGAIIAREYGLPAVANVSQAMTLLKDDDLVTVDAGSGAVHRPSASGY